MKKLDGKVKDLLASKNKKAHLGVTVDCEIVDTLKELAERNGVSLSALVEAILREWVEKD